MALKPPPLAVVVYSPYINRFLQPDSIIPDQTNPQSWNRFSYVRNNPLIFNDPTGHIECKLDPEDCQSLNLEKEKEVYKIQTKFKNVKIKNSHGWNITDLKAIYAGLNAINGKNGFNGNTNAFASAFGQVTFVPVASGTLGTVNGALALARTDSTTGVIRLASGTSQWTTVHEMGHILDGNLNRINDNVPLHSQEFVDKFNLGPCTKSPCEDDNGGWVVAPGTTTQYGEVSSREDFADSFYAVIRYGKQAGLYISPDRVQIITSLIQSYINPIHAPGR